MKCSKHSNNLYSLCESLIQRKGLKSNIIPSGFEIFDADFDGLCCGELTIIAGRPGMGKTSFALDLALNVSANHPVLYFTFDLSLTTITSRIIGAKTGISPYKIAENNIEKSEVEVLKEANEAFKNNSFFISEDGHLNPKKVKRIIKEHFLINQIKLVIIDDIKLSGKNGHKIWQAKKNESLFLELKKLAKKLNIAIVILSQLKRSAEKRNKDGFPRLSDLKGGRYLDQIADKVLLLYRPEYYAIDKYTNGYSTENILEVIVAKNKADKTGSCFFERTKSNTYFKGLENELFWV